MRVQAGRDDGLKMCSDCPFGGSKAQRHMRRSLRPGRFEEIAQAVWLGAFFPCHKTTEHDDETGEALHTGRERQCAGSIQFVERAHNARVARGRRGLPR